MKWNITKQLCVCVAVCELLTALLALELALPEEEILKHVRSTQYQFSRMFKIIKTAKKERAGMEANQLAHHRLAQTGRLYLCGIHRWLKKLCATHPWRRRAFNRHRHKMLPAQQHETQRPLFLPICRTFLRSHSPELVTVDKDQVHVLVKRFERSNKCSSILQLTIESFILRLQTSKNAFINLKNICTA